MGILVGDTHQLLPSGLSISNFVVSIAGSFQLTKIEGVTPVYRVYCKPKYYINQTVYTASTCNFITDEVFTVDLQSSDLTPNVFSVIYAQFVKSKGWVTVTNI